jgi:hypothetical protein
MNGTLKVKTFVATQPSFTTSSLVGTDVVLRGVGGPPYIGYSVYVSSDVNNPLSWWSFVGTGNFKGDGSFVYTIPIDPNGPPQFYSVQYTTP